MSKKCWFLLDTVLPHKGVFYLHKSRDVLWMVIRTLKHTGNVFIHPNNWLTPPIPKMHPQNANDDADGTMMPMPM